MTDERPDVKHIWTMPDGWWRAEALWRPNKTCKQQESYFVACLTASTETKNSSYFDDFLKQVVYCSFMNSSLAPLDPTVVRSHVCLRSLRPATCYYVMSSLAISSPFLLCKDFFYFQFQAGEYQSKRELSQDLGSGKHVGTSIASGEHVVVMLAIEKGSHAVEKGWPWRELRVMSEN